MFAIWAAVLPPSPTSVACVVPLIFRLKSPLSVDGSRTLVTVSVGRLVLTYLHWIVSPSFGVIVAVCDDTVAVPPVPPSSGSAVTEQVKLVNVQPEGGPCSVTVRTVESVNENILRSVVPTDDVFSVKLAGRSTPVVAKVKSVPSGDGLVSL